MADTATVLAGFGTEPPLKKAKDRGALVRQNSQDKLIKTIGNDQGTDPSFRRPKKKSHNLFT